MRDDNAKKEKPRGVQLLLSSHEEGTRGRIRAVLSEWDRPVFLFLASVSLIALALILYFILREAIPVFSGTNLQELLGPKWRPTYEAAPRYGILPMIGGTLLVTIGSMALAIPLGLAAATFIAEMAPGWMKDIAKTALELLAGIPSVVYGFFGLMILSPYIRDSLGLLTGQTALTASLLLAVMALPTIASLAEDALTAVPKSYREASAAMGATHWETTWRVTIPSAFSGLIGAVILGMGRSVGETMAVLMVAGNSPQLTFSFLKSIRTLTSGIALDIAETPSGTTHFHAQFFMGVVLLVITLAMNGIAEWFRGRLAKGHLKR